MKAEDRYRHLLHRRDEDAYGIGRGELGLKGEQVRADLRAVEEYDRLRRLSVAVQSSDEAAFAEQLDEVLRRQAEIEARMNQLSVRHEKLVAEDRRLHKRAGDIKHAGTLMKRLRHDHPMLAPLMGASDE